MEKQYRLMHRLGLTPWEGAPTPQLLRRLVEGPSALPAGLAVDIGCGTGKHAAYLADHGWQVVALDVSTHAIAAAGRRPQKVDWHLADVATAADSPVLAQLAGRVTLVLDLGCLHGLSAAGRAGWARVVRTVAAPGCHAVVLASPPGRRIILPRGISREAIGGLLGDEWRSLPHHGGDAYTFVRRG